MVGVPVKRLKLEFEDHEGNKYTITYSGRTNSKKLKMLLDLMELMGGPDPSPPSQNVVPLATPKKIERVLSVIRSGFRHRKFKSLDIQAAYEELFREPISLSTVATYLSRLHDKGVLLRLGSPSALEYVLASKPGEAVGSVLSEASER